MMVPCSRVCKNLRGQRGKFKNNFKPNAFHIWSGKKRYIHNVYLAFKYRKDESFNYEQNYILLFV